MNNCDYLFIEDDEQLSKVCHDLMKTQSVAVDTEFVRERTFYPIPGLIQLANEHQIYLVDPVKVSNLQPFIDLLENQFVTKVMHSASEDIELFFAMGCNHPKAIFDTQIAATWLGAGLSLSLFNLVKYHNNIELDKSQTRTNWLARPLSAKQCIYAALDVKYLIDIAAKQKELLTSLGFADYVKEDCEIACMPPEDDLDKAYLQIKRGHYLNGMQLGKLSLLAAWRERVARRDDKPKSHVLKDLEIMQIATDVESSSDLHSIPMHPAARRRYADEILAVITEQKIPEDCEPVMRIQDIKNARQLLKQSKQHIDKTAEQKGLPVEVMPSKRILESIILYRHIDWYPKPKLWRGWRKAMLEPILDKLAQELDVVLEDK